MSNERAAATAVSAPPAAGGSTARYRSTGAPARGYSGRSDTLQARLRRIEGQVRGLQRMIDSDAYCIDVLTQISAATRALDAVALNVLDDHVRHCVHAAVAEGGAQADMKIFEAVEAVRRLVRS